MLALNAVPEARGFNAPARIFVAQWPPDLVLVEFFTKERDRMLE